MGDNDVKMGIGEMEESFGTPMDAEAQNSLESQRLRVAIGSSGQADRIDTLSQPNIASSSGTRQHFWHLMRASRSNSCRDIASQDEDLRLMCGLSSMPMLGSDDRAIDEFHHQPYTEGISLREWMNHGFIEANKDERLHIYMKVVQVVDSAHSQGIALKDLRPSSFVLLPSDEIMYFGSITQQEPVPVVNQNNKGKRAFEEEKGAQLRSGVKQHRNGDTMKSIGERGHFSASRALDKEEIWYSCPEELHERGLLAANVYSLGILLFELLCPFESLEMRAAAISDLHHRILPPSFIYENPHEAGFCLWLLHPQPSCRPTTREILQSELLSATKELYSKDIYSSPIDKTEDADLDILLDFLVSLKEQKEKHGLELHENLKLLETDTKNIERGRVYRMFYASDAFEARMKNNIDQLESCYFAKRSRIQVVGTVSDERNDMDLLENRDRENPVGGHDDFLSDICKFTRYSKFEVCGTLRIGSLLSPANVICSLSFDGKEEYLAVAGVSTKIRIFEFSSLLHDSIDVCYPLVELPSKAKLSCVSWNKYLKNHLASADYNGVVQMWDASTGQGLSHYTEHQRRAWSVDFSLVHPTQFASGSDDCLAKLWRINEKTSTSTIRSACNICCVQFSPYSPHLLAFGSADYKTYCYDLRHTRIPWCILAGHHKAVSFVKFVDSDSIVSASIDNTLKLWDLKRTSLQGISADACCMTYKGHTNQKNFVGLSVLDGYIACGSESNEVYAYHKRFPMPITSYKFGSVDPISGAETDDGEAQYVSTVCWRVKSSMLVAASSVGSLKVLKMS